VNSINEVSKVLVGQKYTLEVRNFNL